MVYLNPKKKNNQIVFDSLYKNQTILAVDDMDDIQPFFNSNFLLR